MDNELIVTLTKQVTELAAMVQTLNTELNKLRKENEELRNENKLLKEENEYLKKKLFGVKSEKMSALNSEQLSFNLFNEAEAEYKADEKPQYEDVSYSRKKPGKGKLSDKLKGLKHEKVLIDLQEKDKVCQVCGAPLTKVGEEFLRYEVDFIPAKLLVRDIYRVTYECRECKKNGDKMMVKAGNPKPVIDHSYASPSSIAYIMKAKFVNGVTLYRLEDEWRRMGLDLSRATMANWIITVSDLYLIPLKNRMHEYLLKEKYAHNDESTVQVLNEPGKPNTSKSYMWVCASIKESRYPMRIFEYKPDRKQENPREFFKGFEGKLITDGYAAYSNLEGVTNCYCWAHARRKYADALPKDADSIDGTLVKEALEMIGELFQIEKEIDELSPDEKVRIRQSKSKPILDRYFRWCEDNKNKVLSKSKTSKAINYSLNLKEGLSEYINDGLVPMTNSLDERTIKPFTIGRKNWLFSACPEGADASAAAYSMVESAKANGLDPYKYLQFIFQYLPSQDMKDTEALDRFLPWSEEMQKYCK